MTEDSLERPVVPVLVCSDEVEAEVVVALLRGRDIEAFQKSELPPSTLPVSAGPLGQVTIYVDEAEGDRARRIIQESRSRDA